MNKQEIKEKNKKRNIIIVAAIFLLFVAIFVLVTVSRDIDRIRDLENANFVEVEATIVEYKARIVYSNLHYSTFYEYKSPDGGIYSGCWQARIKTEEEAKSQIGMKVPIYIDDELKLQTKSLQIDKTGVTIGAVLGSLCLLISLGFITYLTVQFIRSRNNKDPNAQLSSKEDKEAKAPKNFCTLNLAVMLFAVVLAIGGVGSSISKEKEYKKYVNANFVEVQGEITEYKEFEKDGEVYFVTYYKYVDADGKEYFDMWQNNIYDKADAENAIGSKVPLYYDSKLGVLKSMGDLKKVPKPNHTLNIILVVVFIGLFVNSLARFIRFIIRNERYEAQQKRQGKTIE